MKNKIKELEKRIEKLEQERIIPVYPPISFQGCEICGKTGDHTCGILS